MDHSPSIHTFVISWVGKHDNAERIAKAVASTSDFVTVVFSDPDRNLTPDFSCAVMRRSNDLFFGDKFRACIDSCEADVLLLIHADCDCDRWSAVPEHCRRAVEQNSNIGVWAPLIDFTDWGLDRTEIDKIPNSPFSIVAQTDAVVFGLTGKIVDRMRSANLDGNVYGWGTDHMYNYYAYSIGLISVVDRSIFVRHPHGTQYSYADAGAMQIEFLKQLTPTEREQSRLLEGIVRVRDRINEAGAQDSPLAAAARQELALLRQRILGGEKRVEGSSLTPAPGAARVRNFDVGGSRRGRRHPKFLLKDFWAYLRRPSMPNE